MAAPVELKVKASTFAASAVGIIIAVLNAVSSDPSVLGNLPVWLQSLILAVVPGLIVFFSGYSAPHTERGDIFRGDHAA